MAEPNAATVELEPEGVVTVDVTDNPDLLTVGTETPVEPVVAVEPEPTPAPTKPKPKPTAAKTNAADEAAAALTQAVSKAETERKAREAAEATAIAERRAREEAQRLAAQREQEAAGYKEQAESGQLAIISSGIENATREIAAYQDEMQRALEAGEFAKVTAAQVKMGKATAALDRLEAEKANFEANARKAPTTEGAVTAPQQVSAFEQYLATLAPRAQSWLRAHPECVPPFAGGDEAKNAAVMKGHYAAIEQKIPQGSDDYFRVLEEAAGYRQPVSAAAVVTPAGEEPEPAPAPKPRPRMAQPSAPVSRDPPSANGQRTTRSVTLSKEQQDAAKISFPQKTPQEAYALYARNLLELEAEGKMGRLTH